MTLLHRLITMLGEGTDPGPFALLRREGAAHLEVFTGTTHTVDRLADVPVPDAPGRPGTLALVPFRQVAERGFAHIDDGTPLECLTIDNHELIRLDDALAVLPDLPVRTEGGDFDISDQEYAEIVGRVLRDEIGHGAGANFVIHRTFRAQLVGPVLATVLSALRRLITGERGAYWTFLVHTGNRTLIGATPERHVSVEDGLVMMNPISGTFRHPDGPADREALLRFLADPKEIDELYMVLDEELKMMATVAERGGQVIGPYLKEMSHLTHTEYLLAGRGSLDVREVLRETMFAPTVTGSPMENACRVIARHERTGRRYYSGVLALLGRDGEGRQTLDAPILIRTAEISPAGELRVSVGATLVRHSTAAGEVAETHAKAAGVLAALGVRTTGAPVRSGAPATRLADDPAVRSALASRNDRLARFWLEQRTDGDTTVPALAGRRVLIIDGEDTFTGMLTHQLRALGLDTELRLWHEVGDAAGFDLTVVGPGPGDPTLPDDPKMAALRGLLSELLADGRPTLAICLGHQLLSGLLGLRLHRRDRPYQGVQHDIDLFGVVRRVGFYSTFTALGDTDEIVTAHGPVRLARDTVDGTVHALRGPTFAGVQFHPESVLSQDGMLVLADLLPQLLPASTTSPR
ncbi:phenazine biosynthesis protein PhzE [Micromonospora sonneratiae]|uniref:anthranilate synthase n=1 Tax=Micromonospora sonneratiae TaxID=1184706 RepID=A0ABW3YJ23_9ACTN